MKQSLQEPCNVVVLRSVLRPAIALTRVESESKYDPKPNPSPSFFATAVPLFPLQLPSIVILRQIFQV